jgi:hypothetical protein
MPWGGYFRASPDFFIVPVLINQIIRNKNPAPTKKYIIFLACSFRLHNYLPVIPFNIYIFLTSFFAPTELINN